MKFIQCILRCVIWSSILISSSVFAIDPSQYGTPFDGVPDPRDAIIYQVNMRCFSTTRDFQGVIDRIDNIKALGINVIYLMPVFPVGTLKSFNSPYCVKDYYSIGSEFGTLDDLRNLIDSAHSKNMAVILDWVANHTAWDHPWISAHKSWYLQDESGNILSPPGQNWTDVAQLNFSNDTMRTAMIEAMRYWVFTANCDGFRCDYAAGPPESFWQQAIDSLRGITTHKLLLFAEGDQSSDYTAGFDYNFSWSFYSDMKLIKSGSAVTLIDYLNTTDYTGATGTQQIVRWLTNHDMYGSEGSPYNIFGGKTGVMADFVITAYMKGIPFIYNGMEVGNTVSMPFPFTSTTINWTEDPSVTPEMTKIIAFRNDRAAIRRGAFMSYSNADICSFIKTLNGDTVFVASNLRNASKNFTLPSNIADSKVYDAYTKDSVTLSTTISLSPYEYKVYTKSLNVPVVSINTISDYGIIIYPNPATNGLINIRLNDQYKNAKTSIYDLQGRIVYENILPSAENSLDISKLNKGLYVITIFSDQSIFSQMLLIS